MKVAQLCPSPGGRRFMYRCTVRFRSDPRSRGVGELIAADA
jgi:hypothetical protein